MASFSRVVILVLLAVVSVTWIRGGHCYQRPKARETLSVPLDDDADGATPQQFGASTMSMNGNGALANGHVSRFPSPHPITAPPASPLAFRYVIKDIHNHSVVTLYTIITASVQHSVRRHQSLASSPTMLHSPIATALRIRCDIATSSRDRSQSSSLPHQSGYASPPPAAIPRPSLLTPTPRFELAEGQFSPILVLRMPLDVPEEEVDPEEDPPEQMPTDPQQVVPDLQNKNAVAEVPVIIAEGEITTEPEVNEEENKDVVEVVFHVFGQNVFEDMDDDAILALIDSVGFLLLENSTDMVEIVKNLRALDQP